MFFTIIITFISLIGLIVLHELGHFIMARRFGVRVEEFGIGLPPRIFGKKIGETIYSLNLLPLGAFVRLYGEEKDIKDPRSFSSKPIWQRILIIIGGVVVFWIVAFVILSILMVIGMATIVGDEANDNLVDPKVQIAQVAVDSPAEKAGLKIGDTIRYLRSNDQQLSVDKVKEVQNFTTLNLGKEITLTIQRGKETSEIKLTPRDSPPEGEGPMGINLARTAVITYPWYQAPFRGILATADLTIVITKSFGLLLKSVITGEGLPPGTRIMGPVGIFGLFNQMAQLGTSYFLRFVAVISVYLAVFNILPIPALDGGRLAFLVIEAVRRKPISQKIEQNITALFFFLLIAMIIFVTFRDIQRLF